MRYSTPHLFALVACRSILLLLPFALRRPLLACIHAHLQRLYLGLALAEVPVAVDQAQLHGLVHLFQGCMSELRLHAIPTPQISLPWCSPACKVGHRCLRPPCFDKTRVSHDLPQTHEQSRIWRALARSRARASRGFAKGSSSQFQEAFRVCVLSERVLILLPYVGCAS